jgi:hypothetical protein
MNIQEAENRYAELAEQCKTDEELDEKINSLDEKEIFALAHATFRESLGNAGLSSVVIQKISAVASCRFEARNQALGS